MQGVCIQVGNLIGAMQTKFAFRTYRIILVMEFFMALVVSILLIVFKKQIASYLAPDGYEYELLLMMIPLASILILF